MTVDPFAVDGKGTSIYVRTVSCWGRHHETLVSAATLTEAKRVHGYTRELYTTISVRRARRSDVVRIGKHA